MKLRPYLNWLVLAAMAPLIAVALTGMWLLVQHDRDSVRRDAIGRARAAMSAVDAELRGTVTSLLALRTSAQLEAGNIPAFYDEARRVLESQPYWTDIGLASPAGIQYFDAASPLSVELRRGRIDDESLGRAVRSGQPAYGNVTTAAGKAPAARISLPVAYEGHVRYVLTVQFDPAMLGNVLRAQGLPDDWVISLSDGIRRVVVRIPTREAGSEISESLREALVTAPEGFFRGRTFEGATSYSAYVTSRLTGWVLGIAIPAEAVNDAGYHALATMAAGGALALVLALFLAGAIARRVTVPISELAGAAAALERGEEPKRPSASGIDEVARLKDAVEMAAHAARERESLLKREKQALERERSVLQAVDRAKNEFLAMLSHELRNPLAALSAAAHVMARVDPTHKAFAHSREVIVRQAAQMRRLIEDLLDMSSVLIGKVSLLRERFDLAALVSEAITAARAGGRLEGHSLAVRVEPVWVDADRSRIEQVLANLLDNALKFTPHGKGVSVDVRRDDGGAMLCVADEGSGFPAADAERIFELFVQGRQGLERSQGGLGIGLALVKRLVELHGGSVTAESPGPRRGARFVVRLPAVTRPEPRPGATDAAPARPKRDVLLVEDSDDVRTTLRDALALSGHRVHEATDGRSALEIAAQSPPSIALIDIGLPDIDGHEVARRIRARDGEVTLIALTGYGSRDDELRSLAAGFDLHLTKPVRIDELDDAIGRARAARLVTCSEKESSEVSH